MPKAYWIGGYRTVPDPEKLRRYSELATIGVYAAGGRFLARGGRLTVHEQGVMERTVIVEWDSYDQALAAYQSELYQKAVDALPEGVTRDFRIVEGVE
jgi:uncharacterized protein (DUF1330 family)